MEKDKKSKKTAIYVILAIIIVGILSYVIINNNGNQNQEQEEQNNEEANYSLIDYNNTENAKIENETKINTSENLLKEKDFNGIIVSDIELTAEGGVTTFLATAKNNTGKKIDEGKIVINFKDSEGNTIAKLNTYLGDIEVGETGNIRASITQDLVNAYDFTIEF